MWELVSMWLYLILRFSISKVWRRGWTNEWQRIFSGWRFSRCPFKSTSIRCWPRDSTKASWTSKLLILSCMEEIDSYCKYNSLIFHDTKIIFSKGTRGERRNWKRTQSTATSQRSCRRSNCCKQCWSAEPIQIWWRWIWRK